MPFDLTSLANALPADSMERLAAATAALGSAESRLGRVRQQQLAVLAATTARMNAFATSLANVSRVPTPTQRSATSPQPAAPHPASPSAVPFNAVVAKFAAAVKTFADAAGRLATQQRKATAQQQRQGIPSPGKPGTPGPAEPEFGDPRDRAAAWSAAGDAIQGAFQRAVSSVRGFVAVASPQTFNDLGASINLLSLEIGVVFTPYVEYAARAIQATARWFNSLSDATKTTIGRVAMAGVALGGTIIALRTMASVIATVRTTWLLAGATMAATPIGAITALVTAVGALAAAWWGVNAAAKAAGFTQDGAGRAGVGGPGQDRRGTKVFTAEEIQQLPEKYRQRFSGLNFRGAMARSDAEFQQVETDYAAAVREMSLDVTAWVETMPEEFRKRLQQPGIKPEESKAIVGEYIKSVEEQIAKTRDQAIPLETAERDAAAKRKAFLEAELPVLNARIERQKDVFRTLTGKAPTPMEVVGLAEKLVTEARESAVAKAKAAGVDISPQEAEALRGPDRFRRDGAASVGDIKPRQVQAQIIKDVTGLEARLGVFKDFAARIGLKEGEDPFLRSKPLVQSRFTDAFSYADNVQLAVLNTGDAESQLLKRQLEELNKSVGDISEKLERAMQRQNEGFGTALLRGFIRLDE